MAVLADLTEAEKYLIAILQDQSGVDQAEFCWTDDTSKDWCFRCWDFQYPWYRDKSKFQIDQAGRAVGKSNGIQMRAWAFPFTNAGEEMLLTAPELIHLDPITSKVEERILSTRLSREFLKRGGTSNGIRHRPFDVQFRNGSRIVGRIPQKDGKGVKGCVAEGTMVLTRRGILPVEDVVVGDEVLTHRRRWKRVQGIYSFENVSGVEVAGGGHRGLQMSDNHRMLARRNRNPQKARRLEEADWLIPGESDEATRHYMGSPTAFPQESVPWEKFTKEMAWVAGRYVADGYQTWAKKRGMRTSARVHVVVDERRHLEVVDRLTAAGLRPTARLRENGTYSVEVSDTNLAGFLKAQFGEHAEAKSLPAWLLGAPESTRRAFLDGYLGGDGHYQPDRGRWTAGTASKALAVGLRLLGQSLGMSCGMSWVDPKVTQILGRELKSEARRSWRVTMTEKRGIAVMEEDSAWQKIRKLTPVQIPVVYDLRVEDDHSYLADGLYSHNMHPKKLEMDEAQDYPEPGWVELGETLKYGEEDATWRSHGVSRGVRDRYYKQTQPESGWKVHRITAMHRPDWTEEERLAKSELYGSFDHPDYRRNILGLHGDASSALFVLNRLMMCVDQRQDSDYNQNEYHHVRINDEKLRDTAMPIEALLDFPARHKTYARVWVGMDVGMTNHPSEILICGEEYPQSKQGGRRAELPDMRLKVLTRVHLERISSPDQRRVLEAIYEFYRPQCIAMDRTGLGLPIFQEIKESGHGAGRVLNGYNFSEKIVIGYEDDTRPVEERWDPDWEPDEIKANVLEYSSDMLRLLVDQQKILLPWDIDMVREFQGQTYVVSKSNTDAYGRKKFNLGKFHALDAARMAILGYLQEEIDKRREVEAEEPVYDYFVPF